MYQQNRNSIVKPAAKTCTEERIQTVNVSTEFKAWHVEAPSQKFAINLDVEGCELGLFKHIVRHWPSGVELRILYFTLLYYIYNEMRLTHQKT